MNHIKNELPICSVITGNLNARCSKWCNKDITNSVDRETDTLTWSDRYKRIINKPTHTANKSSSCIDLIFCNIFNLLANYGVDVPLFEMCHHNIIFGKLTFEFRFLWAMFVKCGIIVALILKIYKKLFGILIGKRLLEIFLLTEKSIF